MATLFMLVRILAFLRFLAVLLLDGGSSQGLAPLVGLPAPTRGRIRPWAVSRKKGDDRGAASNWGELRSGAGIFYVC